MNDSQSLQKNINIVIEKQNSDSKASTEALRKEFNEKIDHKMDEQDKKNDERCKKMDEANKLYHITVVNLISPTRPQTSPGIEPVLSKRQEVVSNDEVFIHQLTMRL